MRRDALAGEIGKAGGDRWIWGNPISGNLATWMSHVFRLLIGQWKTSFHQRKNDGKCSNSEHLSVKTEFCHNCSPSERSESPSRPARPPNWRCEGRFSVHLSASCELDSAWPGLEGGFMGFDVCNKVYWSCWVCLKMRYTPVYSHFYGKKSDQQMDLGVRHFQPNPQVLVYFSKAGFPFWHPQTKPIDF